jgi:hypothetical protein
VENVAGEVAKGSADEILHHPLHIVESAAIGVGVGVAAVGLAAVAPEAAAVVGLAGAAYAADQFLSHVGDWTHDAKVVANPQAYSQTEVAAAKQGAENFGAGATDVAAGVAGGIAGGYLGTAIKTALVAPVADLPPETPPNDDAPPQDDSTPNGPKPKSSVQHAHAQQGNVANVTGQINDPSHAINGAIPIDHSHAVGAILTGNSPDGSDGDVGASLFPGEARPLTDVKSAAAADVPPADAVPVPPKDSALPATPAKDATVTGASDADADTAAAARAEAAAREAAAKEALVKESVAKNQGIFADANANSDGGVLVAQKQDYNVMFRQITEPTKIATLENPNGEDVQPGHWIATRLNADGSPNIERGMVNQWPVTEKTILKSYKASPDDLTQSQFIAGTKTDGPPVHMVQLKEPIVVNTSWGQITGRPGDWLTNYDYDSATQTAGKDYAVVSSTSFGQTYEPVAPKVSS